MATTWILEHYCLELCRSVYIVHDRSGMLHTMILPGGKSKATNNHFDRSRACERHFKIYIFIRLILIGHGINLHNH